MFVLGERWALPFVEDLPEMGCAACNEGGVQASGSVAGGLNVV